MRSIARSSVRAHRGALAGTALVMLLAGALVSVTGVLLESGLRGTGRTAAADVPDGGGMLAAVASSFAGTALAVVVLVAAATVTLALRGRRREFALLRAVGATRGQVRRLISTEVLLVALVMVPVGALPGLWLARLLDPMLIDAGLVGPGFTTVLSPIPVLLATAVLTPTALLAGRLAARETSTTAPTEALRRSATEPTTIGRVRRALAAVLAAAGLAAAFTPVVVPGTIGSASAATSALLLIGAAASMGPLLVERIFGRVAALNAARRSPVTRLAVVNLYGFSRRLTTVVVPLALVLGTGTIQTTVDRTLVRAARQQLTAAVGGDLVVFSDHGLSRSQVRHIAALDGVARAVPLATVPVQVRTDPDDLPGLEALSWESIRLRVIPPDTPPSALDPELTGGSLSDLDAAGTVALSTDLALEIGTRIGRTITLRHGSNGFSARVVATYRRGLGLGDALAGPPTVQRQGLEARTDAVLVDLKGVDLKGVGLQRSEPSAARVLRSRLRAMSLTVADGSSYAATVTNPTVAGQHLSTVLLLLLLGFVGLGAANALAVTTAGRRREFTLLHRTGTTRRQLHRMVLIESLLTAAAAWVVGTAAVIPAVLGVTAGLLGVAVPGVDLAAYLALTGAVLAVTVVTTTLTATRTIRAAERADT